MSDRIVLLSRGRIMQDGTPRNLFERPASRFVAEFMGAENVFTGKVVATADGIAGVSVGGTVLRGRALPDRALAIGSEAFLAVRAEHVNISAVGHESGEANVLQCQPRLSIYKGNYLDTELDTPVGVVVSRQWDDTQSREGKFVVWNVRDCVIGPEGPPFIADTGPGIIQGGKQ